jgi:hypothetical protein
VQPGAAIVRCLFGTKPSYKTLSHVGHSFVNAKQAEKVSELHLENMNNLRLLLPRRTPVENQTTRGW